MNEFYNSGSKSVYSQGLLLPTLPPPPPRADIWGESDLSNFMMLPRPSVHPLPPSPHATIICLLGYLGSERSLGYVSAIETSLEQLIRLFNKSLSSAHKMPGTVLMDWDKGWAKQTWSQLSELTPWRARDGHSWHNHTNSYKITNCDESCGTERNTVLREHM